MTSFKTSLRNRPTGWDTQYLSHVWLKINGVRHCESYNLQAGAKSSLAGVKQPHSGAKHPVGGQNVQGEKCPGSETFRWRNVQWRGDVQGWNVHKPPATRRPANTHHGIVCIDCIACSFPGGPATYEATVSIRNGSTLAIYQPYFRLRIDLIIFGKTRRLFTIFVLRFTEPETTAKLQFDSCS